MEKFEKFVLGCLVLLLTGSAVYLSVRHAHSAPADSTGVYWAIPQK
jgi:hypothetical protein